MALFAEPENRADVSVETLGSTIAGPDGPPWAGSAVTVGRNTAVATNEAGEVPSPGGAATQCTCFESVIEQLMGVGVVLSAPVESRAKSLYAPFLFACVRNGVRDAGSIGSVNVTMNPVGAVELSAAIEMPTLRVVKVFTSSHAAPAPVQPSAFTDLFETVSVIVDAARTSYFWPYFG